MAPQPQGKRHAGNAAILELVFALAVALALVGTLLSAAPAAGQQPPHPGSEPERRHVLTGERAGPEAPPDEVLVRLDQQVDPEASMSQRDTRAQRRDIRQGQEEIAREIEERDGRVRRTFTTVPLLSATLAPRHHDELEALDGVDRVMPNWRFEPHLDDNLPVVGATDPAVLDQGLTGEGQAVAIIDTGIQRDHDFFADEGGDTRVVEEACFLSGVPDTCPNGSDEQTNEAGAAEPLAGPHGLHVSGIAAGSDIEQTGAPDRGMAPEADILAVNVFGSSGATAFDDVVAALDWVVGEIGKGHAVTAVNMSLGSAPVTPSQCENNFEPAFADVVAQLRAADALPVAATGNSGSREFTGAPACVEDVLSVTASDSADRLAPFSDVAPGTNMIAPGVEVRSAVLDNNYDDFSGTSMASPMVAGATALLHQADTDMNADQLEAALTASPVTVDDDRSGGEVTGLPRLDVPAALFDRGQLSVAASTASVSARPGGPATVQAADLVVSDQAPSEFDFAIATTPDGVAATFDGSQLQINVAPDTDAGTYPVEWTVNDGVDEAAATLRVIVSPWQLRQAAPVRRGETAAATDAEGRIYLPGGPVSAGQPGVFDPSGRVDRYDPDAEAWETVDALPFAAFDVAAASDDQGRVYAIASRPDGSGGTEMHAARFDPGSGSWEELAAPAHTRSLAAAASDDQGRVYSIGGFDPDASGQPTVATVERFDPADPGAGWETLTAMDTPRESLGATADANGRIYAIGGVDFPADLASVERFDPGTGNWEAAATLQAPRFAHGAATDAAGLLHAVGGVVPPGHPGTERLDPGMAWEGFPGPPRREEQLGVTGNTGRIHAVAGLTHRLLDGPVALESVEVEPSAATIAKGQQQAFVATAVFSDGSTQDVTGSAQWASADEGVATVDDGGVAAGIGEGSVAVTAEHEGVSDTATLTVEPPVVESVAVEPSAATIAVGQEQAFVATAVLSDGSTQDVTGSAQWSSADESVATVDGGGVAAGVGEGSVAVTAEHEGASDTATLTVEPPVVESVAVEPSAATIWVGQEQAFVATAVLSDGSTQDVTGSAQWASADESVATVDGGGVVSGVGEGRVTLTAEHEGASDTAAVTVEAPPSLTRFAGANRFATAAQLSAASFEPGVDVAYVATGTDFADALTGGVAAGLDEAPVLLVTAGTVPGETADELDRLDPGRIVILGGTKAVGSGVAAQLAGLTTGSVDRLAGAERFATAAAVSQATFAAADTVYVGTGLDFPDGLAGVPAAVQADGPLLLVTADRVPSSTAQELDRLDPDRIVILGGTGVVGSDVAAELAQHGHVDRFAGQNRFDTAARVADELDDPDRVYVATGFDFADALTAGAVAGAQNAPVLLVTTDAVPGETAAALERIGPRHIVVMGGTAAVSHGVEESLVGFLDG